MPIRFSLSTSMLCLLSVALCACSPTEARHKAAGNVLFKKGDLDGALKEYDAAIAVNPKDANSYTLRGNVYFEKERYVDAEREYRAALERLPDARAARQGIAAVALRSGRSDEAKKQYEAMIASAPSDAESHAALGKLLYGAGDLANAEQHLRDALRYVQNDGPTLYALGMTLGKQKKLEDAISIYDRLETVAPQKPYVAYGRASAYAQAGKVDEAVLALKNAFERGMTDTDAVRRDAAMVSILSDPRVVQLLDAHGKSK